MNGSWQLRRIIRGTIGASPDTDRIVPRKAAARLLEVAMKTTGAGETPDVRTKPDVAHRAARAGMRLKRLKSGYGDSRKTGRTG